MAEPQVVYKKRGIMIRTENSAENRLPKRIGGPIEAEAETVKRPNNINTGLPSAGSQHKIHYFHTRNPLVASTNPLAAFEIATHSGKKPRASSSAGICAPPGPSFHKHDTRPAIISSCSVSGSTSNSTSNFEPHARAQSVSKWMSFSAGTSRVVHVVGASAL